MESCLGLCKVVLTFSFAKTSLTAECLGVLNSRFDGKQALRWQQVADANDTGLGLGICIGIGTDIDIGIGIGIGIGMGMGGSRHDQAHCNRWIGSM